MEATPRSAARQIKRPYCLRCYAPLGPFVESRTVCPRCDYLNLKVDQKLYWTREPWLCALERTAKTAIVVLVAWISWIDDLSLELIASSACCQGTGSEADEPETN